MSEPTIVEQLEQAQADLQTAADANAEFDTALKAANEHIAELTEAKTKGEEQLATLTAELLKQTEEVDELKQANEDLTEKNAEQAKALESPEYKQATEGGEPVQDGGEPNGNDLWKQYLELKGAEKTAFWRENKAELASAGGPN